MSDFFEFVGALIGAAVILLAVAVFYGAMWAIPIVVIVLALRALGLHW